MSEPETPARAVTYLRVSSKRQMDTAVDIDPDGNSVATQRDYVGRKAVSLGTGIRREFLEPEPRPRPVRSGRFSANCCATCRNTAARSTT